MMKSIPLLDIYQMVHHLLLFREFETGTYVPEANAVWSKSEISNYYFGPSA